MLVKTRDGIVHRSRWDTHDMNGWPYGYTECQRFWTPLAQIPFPYDIATRACALRGTSPLTCLACLAGSWSPNHGT